MYLLDRSLDACMPFIMYDIKSISDLIDLSVSIHVTYLLTRYLLFYWSHRRLFILEIPT